ncbi:hypothetical protein [Massilia sp. PWRC2]|uniref:hypothetical protein n=1 Tax=Massilia sp. PWRC2 TaxID=2804626 RepID=UPI003CFA2397
MSGRKIKKVFGISLTGKITPTRVAQEVIGRLQSTLQEGITAGTLDPSTQDRFNELLKNFSLTNEPEKIIEQHHSQLSILTKRTDKVRLGAATSIEMGINFCLKAIYADVQNKTGLAWLYTAEAVGFSGAAWGLDQASFHLAATAKATAKSGGDAKANKIEECRREFLKMVDDHNPPWSKTRSGIADAILFLKPEIVRYAKDNQNSVITASTNLPKKWLEHHWGIEKRAYKKVSPSKIK